MDKEQQQRVLQGDKNSHSKQRTSPTAKATTTTMTIPPTATASHRIKSWAPTSKFNKILSNLERSILNQFNGAHHGSGGVSSSSSSSSSSTSLIKTKGQAGKSSTLSISAPNTIPTSLISSSNNNNSHLPRNDNNIKRCYGQQVQKDSVPSERITLQLKSEPTGVKTTLNKYQQQIVSTMRPNHQSILNSSGNGCNNNSNNKISNKLSIPPPHANDEARNQNHRIIFGASAMPIAKLSSDSIVAGSSATLRPSASNRLVATTNTRGDFNKRNDPQNSAETNLIRNNASPASSAKSLPTIATKQIGSQTFNKSINEDEESGFSTYQSRRSLFADNTRANTTTNITTTPQTTATATTGGQNKSQNSNNMIIMQTQMPIGAMNFNSDLATSQQLVYNYQFPQLNHPQQQTVNTHQLVANNQVPIPSTISIDSNKNCYQNHPSQVHHLHSNTHGLSQNHFSDQHLQKNTLFPTQQSHQLYNLYALNSASMQIQVPQLADNGQEIYANAPPKPRRYQYYDSSNPAHLFPPQMIATMTAASTAMTTSTISMANGNNNNGIGHNQHPMFDRQNFSQSSHQQPRQNPYNPPIYNISYLQVPNLYHQQQGLPVQVSNTQQFSYNGADNHQQHRPLNLPYQLTKSKSSLDACDLIQYKLDAQSRSNTLRLDLQHRHAQLQQQQQQQQQRSIYGSRMDNLNRYPSTVQGQQPGMQFPGNNLQRSKSVSHLLQPDYQRQQINQQQRELFIGNGHATIGPKFYSVPSASTTNLNSVGLSNNQQISEQNQFAKISSHLNNSHNQPPQQQYHDLVQKQDNQLFSTTAQRQHPHANWQQQNQVSSNCHELSNQQQRQRVPNHVNAAKTNAAFSNCGTKIVRQPQSLGDKFISEDGFSEPSLDDKIRYLMIGEENTNTAISAASNVMVKSSSQNDKNAIYHLSSNDVNLAQATSASKQQLSGPAELSANCNSILKRENNGGQNANNSNNSPKGPNTNAQKNLDNPELTNRIYINDLASKMGNRQQRQYHINDIKHLDSPPTQSIRKNTPNIRIKNSANSHLIVDLTTPRVLAKTQTTLSSGDIRADVMQRRDPCSINQVGLPQQPLDVMASISHGVQRSLNISDSSVVHQQQQFTRTTHVSDSIENDPSNKSNFTCRPDNDPIFERTAPYYYSDLKSEEQRQALLSIVQHKSLSPPPQLLSRSTDQSSTRLALKSATLHPGHMRMLNGAKEQRQAQGNNNTNLKYHLPSNDFHSTTNISKNIDKLFESPAQPRINAVQSMLALNDHVKDNSQSDQLSNFQATSESTSVGYFGENMKKKNFSKSKSLENINQGFNEAMVNDSAMSKKGNPVYENIRRTDKLMSAINNSTTCLSTSTSRSNRKANYIVESQNINSEESTDSILGSSLDESDSSLDLIDEIKISPSDNHLSDISQLIEQLKINHSKLSEEYKSTMARIAKTINTKNKQTNADHKNDKLARRLQLLKLRSKKCESRGKNQLALIQMMEKVLQQSKARTTGHSLDDSLSSSLNSSKPPTNRERISTSPSLSFDYQNLKQSVQSSNSCNSQAYTSSTSSNSPSTLNSQHSLMSDTMRNFNAQPSISSNTGHNVIKAIVTEAESQAQFVSEVKRPDEDGGGQVSLSTRHHQQSLQGAASLKAALQRNSSAQGGNSTVPTVEMRKIQLDRSTNPFSNNGEDEDNSTSSSSESSIEEVRSISKPSRDFENKRLNNGSDNNNGLDMSKDDEDFIEFLTTDTSDHSSQFGASQFSASDFNSQASTGGDSRPTNKSNNSYPSENHLFPNKAGAMNTTGILKSAKNGFSCSKNNIINNNNNNINGSRSSDRGFNNGKDNLDRSKFNNVLGNVIDVDICPMNNLSENSPVNNRTSCLN